MINLVSPTISSTTAANNSAQQLSVTFWGVRGSVPTPTQSNQRYGGNTVCVEVMLGGQRLIFDGGTGLVRLGQAIQNQSEKQVQAHLFFTHTQWDRIQGFPFFQPAFAAGNHFSIYGGTAPNGASIKHCLTDQMLKPHFSMPLQDMQASLEFHTLVEHTNFYIEDIAVEVIKTNPMTEAFGYRLTWKDRTLVYATDTPTERIDADFLKFVDQADILIYDGTYSDLNYLRNGLDQSPERHKLEPWSLGTEIAKKANVKQLVLLHHSPVQDDITLDKLQAEVRDRFPDATIAQEGMTLSC